MPAMSDYTAKRIDDMEAAFGGGLVKARAELGVTSFGVQIVRLPPDYTDYPEHDHAAEGQEEVYLALDGSGYMEVDGERVELAPDVLVRVGPDAKRKIFPGSDGLRLIAIGGVPGKAYGVSPFTELTNA
jgi:mannose-6-phosphate isomerase-like protein (cupin superfamily)